MQLENYLTQAIHTALKSRKIEPKFRVFKSNSLDYISCRSIPELWDDRAELACNQLADHLGPDSFMAVNEIAQWSAELCLAIRRSLDASQVLKPFHNVKILDVYSFVSSSEGWTPFGAHVDFEHSLIIGVSGADRNIYTWPEGFEFGQLKTNANNFLGLSFNYINKINQATKIKISPSDQHVIAALDGHVFHAEGRGMFIGVSFVEIDANDNRTVLPLALTPTNDCNIDAFFAAHLNDSILWNPAAKISDAELQNGELAIPISNASKLLAENIKSYLVSNFGASAKQLLTASSSTDLNIEKFLCACIKIEAIYVI